MNEKAKLWFEKYGVAFFALLLAVTAIIVSAFALDKSITNENAKTKTNAIPNAEANATTNINGQNIPNLLKTSSNRYNTHLLFPINFSIPASCIVSEISQKTLDFAIYRPGQAYKFDTESEYYDGYKSAYFAITSKKGGWDCMRHYEILANGCIPYFLNLQECPPNTMAYFPKRLIQKAMNLPGVTEGHIDFTMFDQKAYFDILEKLLDITRNVLSTQAMARSFLYPFRWMQKTPHILLLSPPSSPDYQRDLLVHGLRCEILEHIVDVPRIDFLYEDYKQEEVQHLYGRGFSYARKLPIENIPIDRTDIEERIKSKEFDLIVYGSIHRGKPYLDLVQSIYPPEQIVFVCGEDIHGCEYAADVHRKCYMFLRELE